MMPRMSFRPIAMIGKQETGSGKCFPSHEVPCNPQDFKGILVSEFEQRDKIMHHLLNYIQCEKVFEQNCSYKDKSKQIQMKFYCYHSYMTQNIDKRGHTNSVHVFVTAQG